MNMINRTYGGNASGSILRVAIGILGILLLLATEAVASPTISVNPTQGAPGTQVTAIGSGWSGPSGQVVDIRWDGKWIDEVDVNSSGSFTVSFQVPQNAAPGDHTIRFQGREYLDVKFTVTSSSTPTPTPAQHKPVFSYPAEGATLDYEGSYSFKVEPIDGVQEFLWGFFQNGKMVWENFRDEGTLSSNEYVISPGTTAHSKFIPGNVEVWVRASIEGQWTDAAIITIYLQSTTPAPTVSITANPNTHDTTIGTSFIFTANPVGSWGKNIEYSWSIANDKTNPKCPSDWKATGKSISASAACSGTHTISVTAKDEKRNTAHSTYSLTVNDKILTKFNISGYKINDTNGNGKWNRGEKGIQGWNITLKNATTGKVLSRTSTNSAGFYRFKNRAPGKYNISEETKTGWNNTSATFKKISLVNKDLKNLNFSNKMLKFLSSPLSEITVANLPITSVFDHDNYPNDASIPFRPNGTVVAYTGEKGQGTIGALGSAPCLENVEKVNGVPKNFVINGNYRGGNSGSKSELCYDGHDGIDFQTTGNITASANGIASFDWDNDPYHTIKITVNENGYTLQYLHLNTNTFGKSKGTFNVTRGQIIGTAGGWGKTGRNTFPVHLHFTVLNPQGQRVDPYGWSANYSDPMSPAVKNFNLWLE